MGIQSKFSLQRVYFKTQENPSPNMVKRISIFLDKIPSSVEICPASIINIDALYSLLVIEQISRRPSQFRSTQWHSLHRNPRPQSQQ